MYKEVIERLCCPYCHKDLSLEAPEMENDEIISGRLLCACGRRFRIRAGIAEESADDLIPCAGEWFADALVMAQK